MVCTKLCWKHRQGILKYRTKDTESRSLWPDFQHFVQKLCYLFLIWSKRNMNFYRFMSIQKRNNSTWGLTTTFLQKIPELNCNAEMISNKQCHLPFSLLIGNPGSPVMKVGCSPSTVWKRRKKRTCKIHFSWEELNQFFAPTTSILLCTQKIQPSHCST